MKILLVIFCFIFSNSLQAQHENIRIVITPNDSVYKWIAESPDGTTIREFSATKAILLDFDNDSHRILAVQSVCGRGNCPGGIELNFYANGMMESKGQYGYTTDVDSLKDINLDGFLTYVDKVGDWYYWNDKGFLMRKEKWVKGKLVATTRFTTRVLANKKTRRKK